MPGFAPRSLPVVACSIAIFYCAVVAYAQDVDDFNPGANQSVFTVAVQPDGKTVFGGVFTGLGGAAGTTTRNHIGRLNVDGSVDSSFNSGANGDVYAVAVQPDGKILVGGNFNSLGVGAGIVQRQHIGRFNVDGTVDSTFNPGANLNVYVIAVQPDGKILVGGDFSMLSGATRIALGRLNTDGSIDTFDPGASKTFGAPAVYTMALQPDGKIVVGGYFQGLGGGTGTTGRNFIGRIEANGSIDSLFNPGVNTISGVNAVALQADGKIIVGGAFTGLGGVTGTTARQNIGRLNADGSVDTFNPGAESQVLTLGVQADGKILAGGYFQFLGGDPRKYIGRLNANGLLDSTFNPGAGNVVNAVAIQPDGAIVAGGIFVTVGGGTGIATQRNRIARFTNTDAAVQTLSLNDDHDILTWARSGGGPEVSRVTFELSTGGTVYTILGSGTRVPGGWELNELSLPTNQKVYIRARGFYGTGYQTGSGSIVESILTMGHSTKGDFDGDGKADISVFRPSNGTWYTLQSSTSSLSAISFGTSTDVPVIGDYDGDGRTDIAVYRSSSGTWYIYASTSGFSASAWGASGTDLPVPADYDGDGMTDIAVYRPSTGEWFIRQSSTLTLFTVTFGTSTDVPVPSDYDGDGRADTAVYRPGSGTWYIFGSTTGFLAISWGGANIDLPVSADYDGDGRTDIAVYRPSTGEWFIFRSADSTLYTITWGISTDVPVPADYDGDAKADITVYRPSTGTWYILQSSSLTTRINAWGTGGDIPVHKRP